MSPSPSWFVAAACVVALCLRSPVRLAHAKADGGGAPERKNVLGTPLEKCCSKRPVGFFRDGFCRVDGSDLGVHAVCAVVTDEFLEFTRAQGNDLSTPRPQFQFPGLRAGDRWCLCAGRWKEAEGAGKAPKVDLAATDQAALDIVALRVLQKHAVQADGPDP